MATGYTKANATRNNNSRWKLIHGDLKTAQSAGECLYPSSITSSNFRWVEVGRDVGSLLLRARYPTGASAAPGTMPAVIVIAGWATTPAARTAIEQGAALTDGSFVTMRIDAVDSDAAGQVLTLDPTNGHRDGTYKYSDYFQAFPTSGLYGDTLAPDYIAVACKTALSGGTGITTCDLQGLFLPR